jgi:hypothetical protein
MLLQHRIQALPRLTASLLMFVLLFFALSLEFPLVSVSASGPDALGRATARGQNSIGEIQKTTWEKIKPWVDYGLLIILAFLFALLGLLKDFRRYRGLLPVVFTSFYSWVFITFTATCIFAVDYVIYQAQFLHRLITEEAMFHIGMVLGHTGVSAALVYASPSILSLIPTHMKAPHMEPAGQPEREKPITEMNVVYAAIRELLENQVNAKVLEWTITYTWDDIRSTGKMLLTDLRSSGIISQAEFDAATVEEGAYTECEDVLENRDRKYRLLRKTMKHSSFMDLSSRLQRTARIGSVAAPARAGDRG